MNKNSEKVINWRKKTKQRMIDAFDGKCGICDYNKCYSALEFHHLDMNEKEVKLAAMIVNPKKWIVIVEELKKCVCLCANCHREVHGGFVEIPLTIKRFDERFNDYKSAFKEDLELCPICNNEKLKRQKTCSLACAAKFAYKYDWNCIDLHQAFIVEKKSKAEIAKIIGCSESAVRKRLKKLKFIW
jgi:hypothetical protein